MPETVKAPPAGAYVELNINLIDEGRCAALIEESLKEALLGLRRYEKSSGDLTAAATINVKFKLERQKGSESFMDLSYKAETKVPVVERSSSIRATEDKLLCQPGGSSDGDPDQLTFYNQKGVAIAEVNTSTGEAKEPSAVAGKISHG